MAFAFADEAEGTLIYVMLFLAGVAEWDCRWTMDPCVFLAADVADIFVVYVFQVNAPTD